MAEGVDNDMSEHQRGHGAPHGKEAVRSSEVEVAISSSNSQTRVPTRPPSVGNSTGPNPAHKKKSSFQITSVTESKIPSRGDSNGYDGELDLNESDLVDEVEVELDPFVDPGTANGNGGSRFKVVKIQRNESFVRGRWKCHDYPDAESAQNSSGSVSAASSTNISTHVSKDSTDKTESFSSTKINITSNAVGNHPTSETDSHLLDSQTHGSVVKFTTQVNEQNSSSSEAVVAVKKKDSEPRLGAPNEFAKHSDPSIARVSSSALDTSDRASPSIEGAQPIAVAAASVADTEAELPIVNKIASAMEQITQIKSDLLSVVNKEVQTLKETISKLTEENQELKLENEKLRNLYVNRKTST